MSVPQSMEEAEAILTYALNVRYAKAKLEEEILELLRRYERETGFPVYDIYLNKVGDKSVIVEVRV